MQDEDRKAVRSPSVDRDAYERLKLEHAVSDFENNKKALEKAGNLRQRELEQAQERFANKQMSGVKTVSRQRTRETPENYEDDSFEETNQTSRGQTRGSSRNPELTETSEQLPEISFTTAFLMIGLALMVDAIQFILTFIPFVGWILSSILNLVATGWFWIWFMSNGISFSKNQKRTFVVGAVMEVVPILNALPAWTFNITLMVLRYNKKARKMKNVVIEHAVKRVKRRTNI